MAAFLAVGCTPRVRGATQPDRVDRVLGSGIKPSRILIEPSDGVDPLVHAIDRVRHTVWVEAYFISHYRIVRALERAAAEGVDVRVLLERHPYGLGDQSTRMADTLQAAGIAVRWAPGRFVFDHAKVMLLDSRLAVISTANFSHAGFTTDRDVVVFDSHPPDARAISAIFRADWDRISARADDANLVVSPGNARLKLSRLVERARRTIDIYAEEFGDMRFERLLTQAVRRGVRVRVLLPPGAAPARRHGIEIGALATPYIHAKVMMVDRRETFVGSENLSPVSLARNREIGVLIRGVPRRLTRIFRSDWQRARKHGR